MPGANLPLLSVSQVRGVLRRSELTDKVHRADSLDVYKVCRKGDIVFNKMSVASGAMGGLPPVWLTRGVWVDQAADAVA